MISRPLTVGEGDMMVGGRDTIDEIPSISAGKPFRDDVVSFARIECRNGDDTPAL
jgi:hypothetical protein